MKKIIFISIISALAAGLTACGSDGNGGGQTTVVTPPAPTDPNVKYGAKFAAAFKADANSTPAAVSPGDVVPVDPSATPSPL